MLILEHCDIAMAPTVWQKNLHPGACHDKLRAIHGGVDTAGLHPGLQTSFTPPGGKVLRAGDRVLTHVAHNLPPYRGFHVYMRALPNILEQNPDREIVAAGGDGASNGALPQDAPRRRACAMDVRARLFDAGGMRESRGLARAGQAR